MKYKIEIWRFHSIVDVYENDDIKEVLEWYKENWQLLYDFSGCTFYLYKKRKNFLLKKNMN